MSLIVKVKGISASMSQGEILVANMDFIMANGKRYSHVNTCHIAACTRRDAKSAKGLDLNGAFW